ncbi:HTH DNA-binding protein [Methanosarcina barkeri str. Wiesmoor]|uniref:HTH DNA-binding protein n=1 Tax=Methanosarcina barkeri str. Wiesmoor TaxID=1434109 RepID=A0A0E3QJS3_METBA|nr:hypothetical protein [Methanosarcina barkeri]AKB49742.1 HTH DNA-binding protein [Methanosarcina barkeri str. Wiesmoor]
MANRVKRRVSCLPKATYYKPRKVSLCDLVHVDQNKAADMMSISRKTF